MLCWFTDEDLHDKSFSILSGSYCISEDEFLSGDFGGEKCWDPYLGQDAKATQAITQALEAGLPPVLLAPLYWLEQEQPEMYQSCAEPFLVQYGV